MKMKKKGYAMGGMKKDYAMGGMKKKMKAGGGIKKFNEGAKVERPTGMMTQKQIDDPKRAVAAGNRMSKMRAQEDAMGQEKPMRPKKRPTTAPMTSMTPPSRPRSPAKPAMSPVKDPVMAKKGGSIKKMKAGGMAKKGFKAGGVAKKGKSKGGKMGGKSKVRGAGIAQRGVRPAQMR